jgi:hypothetical protein
MERVTAGTSSIKRILNINGDRYESSRMISNLIISFDNVCWVMVVVRYWITPFRFFLHSSHEKKDIQSDFWTYFCNIYIIRQAKHEYPYQKVYLLLADGATSCLVPG